MGEGRAKVEFVLNGDTVVVWNEPVHRTLLDYVRSRGLTGAKEGCAEGECGACAVLLSSPDSQGPGYRSVNSCLMALPAVAGRSVYTVEALAGEAQTAMATGGGSQCGYCTPGFVVSMVAEQMRSAEGARDPQALGGNLCRCTGYRPIGDALRSLGTFEHRLKHPGDEPGAIDYTENGAAYIRPATLAACLNLVTATPGVRLVAGNTDVGVRANLFDERIPQTAGIDTLPELRSFEDLAEAIEIGAALTLSEIEERWTSAPEAFHEWLELFASRLIRNRATFGGNLATASPIGDSAPFLLALDAELVLASVLGERTIRLQDFFLGYRQTALEFGELIKSIRIPKPLPSLLRFYKVAKRRLDDISTVAAGIGMRRDAQGLVRGVRIGLGGVAATPIRAFEAEAEIEGTHFREDDAVRAAETLSRTLRPMNDHRGSAAYRSAMAGNLIRKFRYELLG